MGGGRRVEVADGVVLWHADALEVLPSFPDESVEMIWTDPPYGHGNADGDLLSRRAVAIGDGIQTRHEPIANDMPETMRAVVDGMLTEAARVLRKDCCCCCCGGGGGGPSPTFAWVANRLDRNGLSFFHSVIWDKKNPGMGWRYRRQHEMVMVAHRKGGRLRWADEGKAEPNILSISPPRDRLHPNQKPLALVKRFVVLHTVPGDTVLDPFAGSGTTAVACVQLGRRCVAIEQDGRYFEVMVKRVERAVKDQRDSLFPAAPPPPAAAPGLFTEEGGR